MEKLQLNLFSEKISLNEKLNFPSSYKGIYSFHKYWGKKPIEIIKYFIQTFTKQDEIVLDPFMGSGLISRECLSQNRRFIGVDINPFSVEHAKLILDLPNSKDFLDALMKIEKKTKNIINETYLTQDSKVASHYLWSNQNIIKIWIKPKFGKNKIEFEPSSFDKNQFDKFENYTVKKIRPPIFFENSRINASKSMTIYDFFTKRALYNIDVLLDEIDSFPESIRRALQLTLTSSSGQMSSMVFAITGRGKTKGQLADRIEVGSWAIGFWRPELHFEINVWNCFESRARKLYKAILELNDKNYHFYSTVDDLPLKAPAAILINEDFLKVSHSINDKTIKLICTDPPHSDRIPYLELSELWNSILNKSVLFEQEIVISNAKERGKTKKQYLQKMKIFMSESSRILTDDGVLIIFFNARDKESWQFINLVQKDEILEFVGTFPIAYSATSIVQDNREGSMKSDYALIFKKKNYILEQLRYLTQLSGWTTSLPIIKTL